MIMSNPRVRNQLHRRSTLFEQKKALSQTGHSETKSSTQRKSATSTDGTPHSDNRTFRINKTSDKNRPRARDISIITIGISTGGPAALMQVLPLLGKDFPVPILIAQHMPPHFTNSLARRLDSKAQISVKEAEDGEIIKPGTAYIAEGGKQMYLSNANKITISDKPEDELYKPSVNVLFDSVTKYHKHKSVGIIMTGMGHDGSEALTRMRAAGGFALTQTIDSCIATGMPETVIKAKQADEIYPLDKMAAAIESLFE
jgi:two-component system chemotaxis response regulator CheB